MHADPIIWLDGAAGTLLTIQYNLCLGTILDFGSGRKDLKLLINDLLAFRTKCVVYKEVAKQDAHSDCSGQYCLTEIGHGLDAVNLETTATALPSGGFELHTPSPSAAK
jgi:acyl-CoA oxidase